jgi:hypothetical protein
MRLLVPGLLVALALGVSGCGGGGSGGNDNADAITATVQKDLAADTGLHPGLSLGGLLFAVKDEATGFFSGPGVRAEKVKVSHVVVDKNGKTAKADVRFGLVDQGVTCVGSAMAARSGDAWKLSGVVVTSCQ